MEQEQTNIEEQNYRINIKQTAKGFGYFDITVRGQSKEEIENRLQEATTVALKMCSELNKNVNSEM